VQTPDFNVGILNGQTTKEEIAKKLAGNFSLPAGNAGAQEEAAQLEAFFKTHLDNEEKTGDVILSAVEYLRQKISPADAEKLKTDDLFNNKIKVADVYSEHHQSAPTLAQRQDVLRGITSEYPKDDIQAIEFLSTKGIVIVKQDVVNVGDVIDTPNIILGTKVIGYKEDIITGVLDADNIVLGTTADKLIYNDPANSNGTNINGNGASDMGITLTGVTAASFGTTNFNLA
jgi:hypothetical protein